MKVLEKVLVAVDFGANTDSVVASATRIAKTFGSEIHLLHVLPVAEETIPEFDEMMERQAQQQAVARLKEIRSRLDESEVWTAEEQIAQGTPFNEIMRVADDLDANVILVGSRNETHANEYGLGKPTGLLGTTAERLCRKASKPVWVVGSESETPGRSILCPVDFSSPSRRALKNAIHLARRFDVELIVLHVIRPLFAVPGLGTSDENDMQESHVKLQTSKFERFLGDFDFHNVRWSRVLRQGVPEDEIVAAAAEFSVDLMIMGSVGRTGLSRILLGSVASKVARRLPCSMVMMKAEDAVRLKLEEDLSDLKSHYTRACELLEEGFLDEAKRHFEQCIRTSDIFTPAWEGLAEVYQRQGKPERAEQSRESAKQIEERLLWQQVQADIRRNHPLWKRG